MNQPRVAPKFAAAGRELCQILRDICDPYRPELYYMRGPGPKWTAAHETVHAVEQVAAAVSKSALSSRTR